VSYHGYLPLVKQHVLQRRLVAPPTLLEVGVDRGVSFITMVVFLARTCPQFVAMGIDVLAQEQVALTLAGIDVQEPNQVVRYVEGNSLAVLPRLAASGAEFDVVLLDGDHNYHTVSEELRILEPMTRSGSIIVVDDYDGRWSERDLYYSERPEYAGVAAATPRQGTALQGVKPAVDRWLASRPGWTMSKPIEGEPVLLVRS